jgi:uncharacterized protein YgiM (DUF1202 family)
MHSGKKISAITFIFVCAFCMSLAEEFKPFPGLINTDNINIRSDATVNSKIICNLSRGKPVEVVLERYDWYKIRLPKTAPSFIRKDLVTLIDEKTAKVAHDRVNIRLGPNEDSWVLGQVDKNEVIAVLDIRGQWYKINPTNNSFGWVYKKFVDKLTQHQAQVQGKEEDLITPQNVKAQTNQDLILEGYIKPYGKVFRRLATHKLVDKNKNIYLLKGDKKNLDALNYRHVKVSAKPIENKKEKYPIIEVLKIEVLD